MCVFDCRRPGTTCCYAGIRNCSVVWTKCVFRSTPSGLRILFSTTSASRFSLLFSISVYILLLRHTYFLCQSSHYLSSYYLVAGKKCTACYCYCAPAINGIFAKIGQTAFGRSCFAADFNKMRDDPTFG